MDAFADWEDDFRVGVEAMVETRTRRCHGKVLRVWRESSGQPICLVVGETKRVVIPWHEVAWIRYPYPGEDMTNVVRY